MVTEHHAKKQNRLLTRRIRPVRCVSVWSSSPIGLQIYLHTRQTKSVKKHWRKEENYLQSGGGEFLVETHFFPLPFVPFVHFSNESFLKFKTRVMCALNCHQRAIFLNWSSKFPAIAFLIPSKCVDLSVSVTAFTFELESITKKNCEKFLFVCAFQKLKS